MLTALICCRPALTHVGAPWLEHAQAIPGRVQCEFYNQGGEGVAYHDTDSLNNGSGKLNPPNGNILNEFRMQEGVDISYTKSRNIDQHAFNKVQPELNQLYVGWTEPGEWINYTLYVKETGWYRLGIQYTAHATGVLAFDLNGEQALQTVNITSTYDPADTVAWRQWHHWNRLDSLGEIWIRQGTHVLTLRVVGEGNMNFDFLEFTKR